MVKTREMDWRCKATGKSARRHLAVVLLVDLKGEKPKVARFTEFSDSCEVLRTCS